MHTAHSASRKAFIMIMFVITLLYCLTNTAFYFGMQYIFSHLTVKGTVSANMPEVVGLIHKMEVLQSAFRCYFIPVAALIFILLGLALWLSLRKMLGQGAVDEDATETSNGDSVSESAKARRQEQKRLDRRMFVHLLSVFQREGRLVDFFAEDITIYDDAQIGAAVRNIHENCRKTMDKYIAPKAVLDQNEGDQVSIEEGFDPDQIKLTGNVTGEPPFKGIIRHKGWQAGKLEIPTFSSAPENDIIAPAEVEII